MIFNNIYFNKHVLENYGKGYSFPLFRESTYHFPHIVSHMAICTNFNAQMTSKKKETDR